MFLGSSPAKVFAIGHGILSQSQRVRGDISSRQNRVARSRAISKRWCLSRDRAAVPEESARFDFAGFTRHRGIRGQREAVVADLLIRPNALRAAAQCAASRRSARGECPSARIAVSCRWPVAPGSVSLMQRARRRRA